MATGTDTVQAHGGDGCPVHLVAHLDGVQLQPLGGMWLHVPVHGARLMSANLQH